MNRTNNKFMEYVQEHERAWGTDEYPARPTLADILAAPVVAFWLPTKGRDKREFVTVHGQLANIKSYLLHLVLNTSEDLPDRRLIRVFYQQKLAIIKAVNVEFDIKDVEE